MNALSIGWNPAGCSLVASIKSKISLVSPIFGSPMASSVTLCSNLFSEVDHKRILYAYAFLCVCLFHTYAFIVYIIRSLKLRLQCIRTFDLLLIHLLQYSSTWMNQVMSAKASVCTGFGVPIFWVSCVRGARSPISTKFLTPMSLINAIIFVPVQDAFMYIFHYGLLKRMLQSQSSIWKDNDTYLCSFDPFSFSLFSVEQVNDVKKARNMVFSSQISLGLVSKRPKSLIKDSPVVKSIIKDQLLHVHNFAV